MKVLTENSMEAGFNGSWWAVPMNGLNQNCDNSNMIDLKWSENFWMNEEMCNFM